MIYKTMEELIKNARNRLKTMTKEKKIDILVKTGSITSEQALRAKRKIQEMNDFVKMIIVMRTNFPDGKGGSFSPRKGKMIAQGAHAASTFLINKLNKSETWTEVEKQWLETGTTKICVRVDDEKDLLDIYEKAQKANLEVNLITDLGKTEFIEPTITCLAIGPAKSTDLDKITGHLKLL